MNIRKVSLVILALTAFGVANAQSPSQGRDNRKNGEQHQQGERVFRNAIQEIGKGIRELKNALHIYDGHRVEAIQYGALAIAELRLGRIENRQQSAPKTESDREDRRKYSAEQIAKSNAKLIEAGKHYQNALLMLQKTPGDFNGHKVRAMQDLTKGIEEIKLGLRFVGGQILP